MIPLVIYFTLLFAYLSMTSFSLANSILGGVLSFLLLTLMPQLPRVRQIQSLATGGQLFRFGLNALYFVWDFLKDLTLSNLQITYDIWTPKDYYDPTIVYVPVEDLTDFEVMVLSSRITLTPGTLSCDVTADRRFLVVHAMYSSGKTTEDLVAGLRAPIDMLKRGI